MAHQVTYPDTLPSTDPRSPNHTIMSDAEIERIFRSLDRIEARLSKLEEREAMRRGAEMTRWQMLGAIVAISTISAAATAIFTTLV